MSRIVASLASMAVLFASACGGPKCGVADQVAVVDQRDGLFLVYRMTGMQEKVEFFELYQEKPSFDICGATPIDPVSTEMFERSEGLLKGVRVRERKLSLVFTSKRSEAVDPRHARMLP